MPPIFVRMNSFSRGRSLIASLVGVTDERIKAIVSQIALQPAAVSADADAQTAEGQAGLAERNLVDGGLTGCALGDKRR
ncbi:MAG: hypothetical protein ONB24_12315 [candidate division KSB1 bacterium]|nr:hypothetical protein [candidate division KSB1 bacterium]